MKRVMAVAAVVVGIPVLLAGLLASGLLVIFGLVSLLASGCTRSEAWWLFRKAMREAKREKANKQAAEWWRERRARRP